MESTSCGSGVASARVQVSGGAALLYNNAALDALLLRLNNSAPSGSVYAGWDSSVVSAGSNFTVIHHPAGDVKKVSLGQVRGLGTYNGAGSFVNVAYTSATTEGGSSGAGLLIFSMASTTCAAACTAAQPPAATPAISTIRPTRTPIRASTWPSPACSPSWRPSRAIPAATDRRQCRNRQRHRHQQPGRYQLWQQLQRQFQQWHIGGTHRRGCCGLHLHQLVGL